MKCIQRGPLTHPDVIVGNKWTPSVGISGRLHRYAQPDLYGDEHGGILDPLGVAMARPKSLRSIRCAISNRCFSSTFTPLLTE